MRIVIEVEWDALRRVIDEPNEHLLFGEEVGRNAALALCKVLDEKCGSAVIKRLEVCD